MSAALLTSERPEPVEAPRLGDGPTLDDVVSRTWEVLRAGVPASCVVCGGDLEPAESTGAGFAGARCRSCGTTLG
jgi:hypothetical protein